MVGTRNIAFPRLNAFSYWMYLFGGLHALGRLRAQHRRRTPAGSPTCRCRARSISAGKRVDVWAQMITFTEIAALAVAVEIIVTIVQAARAGHVARPHPLFVWAMLVTVVHGHLRDARR